MWEAGPVFWHRNGMARGVCRLRPVGCGSPQRSLVTIWPIAFQFDLAPAGAYQAANVASSAARATAAVAHAVRYIRSPPAMTTAQSSSAPVSGSQA